MANEITKNLVYLTEYLTNLEGLITRLQQDGIVSRDERETILYEPTTSAKNYKFWDLLIRKDWESNRNKFLTLLRQTNNVKCADKIEGVEASEIQPERKKTQLMVLKDKWWPEEKCLPYAFQKRKLENGIVLIEDLYKKLDDNNIRRSTVICQGATVSGLGGVGKTTLAKWFAQHYQDLYDHIIWIDCGEGSLIISFTNLAKELELDSSLTLALVAKKCFSKFEGFNTLFIFDNAECYQGPQGIRQVLPKPENIHSIITSRNREWGCESGDGQIPELQLNSFDINESIIFLKNNLKGSDLHNHDLIQEVCELLGNHPLALQIAVNTINKRNITLEDYFMRIKTTTDILNQRFDDYEKTINKTMQISLDLIKDHDSDSKKVAYNILLIFGYITPDFVELDFFEAIEKSSKYEVQIAVELLENYSLIDCTYPRQGEMRKASIHRLLQQVIRHNSKDFETSLLRKILDCRSPTKKDFIQYKLIPYSFANEELKEEFPNLRAELIDQLNLKLLLKDRRFTEAVELSQIIKNALNIINADYNYAFCMTKCSQFEKSVEVLEKCYTSMNKDAVYRGYDIEGQIWKTEDTLSAIDEMGIFDLREFIKIEVVAGLLFHSNLKAGNISMANKIINDNKILLMHKNMDFLDDVLKFLAKSSSILNYYLYNSNKVIVITVDNRIAKRRIAINDCSLFNNLPCDLHDLSLTNVNILFENGTPSKHFDISKAISTNLVKLVIKCSKKTTKMAVWFDNQNMPSLSYSSLTNCHVVVTENHGRISPIQLEMNKVSFIQDGRELERVCINEFVDFSKTSYLKLGRVIRKSHEFRKVPTVGNFTDIYFDASCPMDINTVSLSKVKCFPFEDLMGNINKLLLKEMNIPTLYKPTKMKLNHLQLNQLSVKMTSLVYLSRQVEKITLDSVRITYDLCNFPSNKKMLIRAKDVEISYLEIDGGNSKRDHSLRWNDLLCFNSIKKLTLLDLENEDIILDFNELISMEYINLKNTISVNWENSKCYITELHIWNMNISKLQSTEIRVKKLFLHDVVLDWNFLAAISRNAEAINLSGSRIHWDNSSSFVQIVQKLTCAEVKFEDVRYFAPDQSNNLLVNRIINFGRLKKLEIICNYDKNATLDMKDLTNLEYIDLKSVKLVNSDKSRPQIKNMRFEDCTYDFSMLPSNIQTISLGINSNITFQHLVNLQDLIYINLSCRYFMKVIQKSTCTNLTSIELQMTNNCNELEPKSFTIDLKYLPKTIRNLKLVQLSKQYDKESVLYGEVVLDLDKLVLENFHFVHLKNVLSKLKPEIFVFSNGNGRIPYHLMNSIMQLFEKPAKQFVFGRCEKEYEIENIDVEKEYMYYLFEENHRMSIAKTEFVKYLELCCVSGG